MIRQCTPQDMDQIYAVINDAAQAYKGHIPDDCYPDPYMSMEELRREMGRITFFGWEERGQLVGVIGYETVKDVTLLRHAYVVTKFQRQGIGTKLLQHIVKLTPTPRLLLGTWAGASWAIDFYKKHGFTLMPNKEQLLKSYWNVPDRQIEESVVLGIELPRST